MHDSGNREINPAFKMANKCSKVKSFDKKPNIVFFAAFVFIIGIVSRFISNRDGYPYIRNGYIQTPIKGNIQISKNSFLGSICLYHVCSQKQQSPTGTDIPQNVAHPSLRNKDTLLYYSLCAVNSYCIILQCTVALASMWHIPPSLRKKDTLLYFVPIAVHYRNSTEYNRCSCSVALY